MIKELEAISIASYFLQLLKECKGDNAKKENISDYIEIFMLEKNGATHEIQFRKDYDGTYLSSSLNSFLIENGEMKYIYKNILMEFQEDGRKTFTIRDPKSNSEKSWITTINVDQFGQIEGTEVKKTKVRRLPKSVGTGLELVSKVLRALSQREVREMVKSADNNRQSIC